MAQIASISQSLKVWNYESGHVALKSTCTNKQEEFTCLAWNHTNQVVAVGGTGSKIDLIEANTGKILSSLDLFDKKEDQLDQIRSVAFSGNSRFLATSTSKTVQLWDLKKRVKKQILTDSDIISCVSFMPNGDVFSGNFQGNVRLWDPSRLTDDNNSQFQEFRYVDSFNGSDVSTHHEVTSLHVSVANSSHIACGYSDGYLCTLDTNTLQLQRKQRCHYGILSSVCYSPKNNRLVATAGADGRVLLVDTTLRTSTSVDSAYSALIEIDGQRLTALTFHEDAIHIAVGTDGGDLLVYDWRNVRQPVSVTSAHEGERVNGLSFQVPKVVSTSRPATAATSAANIASTNRLHSASVDSLQSLKGGGGERERDNASVTSVGSDRSTASSVRSTLTSSTLPQTLPPTLRASTSGALPLNTISTTAAIPSNPLNSRYNSTNNNVDTNRQTETISALTTETSSYTRSNTYISTTTAALPQPPLPRNTYTSGIATSTSSVTKTSSSVEVPKSDFISNISPIINRTNPNNINNNNITNNSNRTSVTPPSSIPPRNLFGGDRDYSVPNNSKEVVSDDAFLQHPTKSSTISPRHSTSNIDGFINSNNIDVRSDNYMTNFNHKSSVAAPATATQQVPPVARSSPRSSSTYTAPVTSTSAPIPVSISSIKTNNNNSSPREPFVSTRTLKANSATTNAVELNPPKYPENSNTSTSSLPRNTSTSSSTFNSSAYVSSDLQAMTAGHNGYRHMMGGVEVINWDDEKNEKKNGTNGSDESKTNNTSNNRADTSTKSQPTGSSSTHNNTQSPLPFTLPTDLLTKSDLESSLDILRYDIHREVQEVIREQIRQFSLAQDDTTRTILEMSGQLADLLRANKELREENERLRHTY